eukprot:TRINITY_DN9661_c0_g1_i8.p1 TRINITY_DN9661_c0_g1~~TRINITY_DN9661_c0_g1_i8.p1  ORF type:complete len:405 (-),score=49.52 TRINITY_DN9661_c0_g1_i8:130-1344(-)
MEETRLAIKIRSPFEMSDLFVKLDPLEPKKLQVFSKSMIQAETVGRSGTLLHSSPDTFSVRMTKNKRIAFVWFEYSPKPTSSGRLRDYENTGNGPSLTYLDFDLSNGYNFKYLPAEISYLHPTERRSISITDSKEASTSHQMFNNKKFSICIINYPDKYLYNHAVMVTNHREIYIFQPDDELFIMRTCLVRVMEDYGGGIKVLDHAPKIFTMPYVEGATLLVIIEEPGKTIFVFTLKRQGENAFEINLLGKCNYQGNPTVATTLVYRSKDSDSDGFDLIGSEEGTSNLLCYRLEIKSLSPQATIPLTYTKLKLNGERFVRNEVYLVGIQRDNLFIRVDGILKEYANIFPIGRSRTDNIMFNPTKKKKIVVGSDAKFILIFDDFVLYSSRENDPSFVSVPLNVVV